MGAALEPIVAAFATVSPHRGSKCVSSLQATELPVSIDVDVLHALVA